MDLSFLSSTALFRGIPEPDLENMLTCLQAYTAGYEKGDFILRCGQPVQSIGLVLSGSVTLERDDFWGNKSLIGHAEPGEIFAETYACIPGEPLLLNAVAARKTQVLFLNIQRILTLCPNSCGFHQGMIQNLLQITARKNLQLSRRSLYTAPKSIRGRVMTYFSDCSRRSGGGPFTLPYSRQQLADFLGVDRSALSAELSRMQRDGLLEYSRNTFLLKQLPHT